MKLLVFLLPAFAAVTATGQLATNLFWCSWAAPNQTLTLGGANLSSASSATIASIPSAGDQPITVAAGPALQLSASAAQFVVPNKLPHGAYRVTVGEGAPFICGAPDIWWAQGEAGNVSVAGGWLRVFGRNLALLNTDSSVTEVSITRDAFRPKQNTC